MKRSLPEDAEPRKKLRIELEQELEDEDSQSSITTPDLLSDEESRYASALLGDVNLPEKPISDDSDPEHERPMVELETALASINQAMAEKSQKVEFDVSGIERSVTELATVLAPMAEDAQSKVLESSVDINLPDIEKSVSEITTALTPLAKGIQYNEEPLVESQVELNVPEIEKSVTELAAVLAPMAQDTPTDGKIINKKSLVELNLIQRSVTELSAVLAPMSKTTATGGKIVESKLPEELNVPEIERSVSELTTVLTSFDSHVDETQTCEIISGPKTQDELRKQFQGEVQNHQKKKQVAKNEEVAKEADQEPRIEKFQLPTRLAPPSDLKADVPRVVGGAVISVEERSLLAKTPDEVPQLCSVDTSVLKPSSQHQSSKISNIGKFASLPVVRKTSTPASSNTLSMKSDTKKSNGVVDVKPDTPPQRNPPQGQTTEKAAIEKEIKPQRKNEPSIPADVPATSSSIVKGHVASSNIPCNNVVLRAVKEDLVKAYKAILKPEGGGISDAKLGSLLLWLGVPKVSVNRHVRRILRRKRKSGKASKQTSLKNILRYLNYVFA